MAEVISWGSAVFSMGLDLYESGQVMSHESWHSWHFAKMSKSHSPLALSSLALGWDHQDRTLLLSEIGDESEALRGGSWWNICHMSQLGWPCSQQVLIWRSGIGDSLQTLNMGEERKCGTGGEVCWKWNWAEYLTFLTLLCVPAQLSALCTGWVLSAKPRLPTGIRGR